MFTGDTHAFWLFENNLETTLAGSNDTAPLVQVATTKNEYKRGQVVEYGGTAVSSNGWGSSWGSAANATKGAQGIVENNAAILFSEGFRESNLTR
jgi:alkaline phosphatase D